MTNSMDFSFTFEPRFNKKNDFKGIHNTCGFSLVRACPVSQIGHAYI